MMIRFCHLASLGVALSVFGCGAAKPPPPSAASLKEAPRDRLGHIVEQYWDESTGTSPWHAWGGLEFRYAEPPADAISPQELADALAVERRYLESLNGVPRSALDAESQLTYDIFRRERALAIEGFQYPAELMPVNPYDSVPQRFALTAAATAQSALRGGTEADQWREGAKSYQRWTNQAIANMREGMRRGYTLPKILIERMLPQLAALGEDSPNNFLYLALVPDAVTPVPAAANTETEPGPSVSTADAGTRGDADARQVASPERDRVAAVLRSVARDEILPSYRNLLDFLQHEYLPRARESAGLAALPLGATWYAYRVKRAVGDQTPAQLHALGLAEMERLHGRLQTLLTETAFSGNGQGFLDDLRRDSRFSYQNAAALLAAYQDLKAQAAAAASVLANAPAADFAIRRVEEFRAADAPAVSYERALMIDKNSAVFYVNTSKLDSRPATSIVAQFLSEAVPGRHFQLSLQQERTDLPKFRRFGGAPAFIDGWALYAAAIGEELGMYHDVEAKFGSLLAQLNCAAGMVVDTGIHAQKWTRQQAIDYLHSRLPIDDESAANAVDRDMALPGKALACGVGLLKIQGLRAKAAQSLGARFDERSFHSLLLHNGALPMDLLESTVEYWVASVPKMDPP